ncbi:hypothetical protein GY45DRAFT_1331220 [Cubamyces sp. BRFM 1775]|nr:hypothetical protein GY45DRAFT_1331220 [Cubamyces sp. BRFM 1775]
MSQRSHPTPMFPSPFTFILNYPVPLVELRLRRFSREIHAKPQWWEKVYDPDVAVRWRTEIIEFDREMIQRFWAGEERFNEGSGEKQWPRDPITEAQLVYLFDELRYVASQRDGRTGTVHTTIPMVYEASALITGPIKSALRDLARKLEDIPENQKDWHPGSNHQVLDLIHPSLFCLRIGQSFVRSLQPGHTDGLERLTEKMYLHQRPDIAKCVREYWVTRSREDDLLPFEFTVSKAHQWLPTDFEVTEGGQVRPMGYINNFHPLDHAVGYKTISSVLERFIPLFERVVSDQLSSPAPPIFPIDPLSWYGRPYAQRPEAKLPQGPERDEWRRRHLWPKIPEVHPFRPPGGGERVAFSLRGRAIQVIVKMANIVLTPENPIYQGGSWHVEGMANERIVATGLYYYGSDNITESQLMFRAAVGDGRSGSGSEFDFEWWDHKGWLVVYGITRDLALNQQLGYIVAQEDKCVVFPNIYQHRVAPFELVDRSRPGHRKILAFFLVDPLTPVHSTSVVPPQQAHWYRDAVYQSEAFRKLPTELIEEILTYALEGTITIAEAERYRAELMEERAQFVLMHNEEVFEMQFSLCEH